MSGALVIGTAFCLSSLWLQSVQGQTSSPPPSEKQEFEAGNADMQRQDYAGALGHYKAGLSVDPDRAALLYDAGLASYLSHQYDPAALYWTHLMQVTPDDWRVQAKLVQTYQALGNSQARDAARQALFDMRRKQKKTDLSKQKMYCREQFEAGGQPVLSYEFFDLSGSFAMRYWFVVVDKAKDNELYHLALESDAGDNEMAKQLGTLKPGERIFSLDGYYYTPGSKAPTQKLYGMYQHEPSYEQARAEAVRIIAGQTRPAADLESVKPLGTVK